MDQQKESGLMLILGSIWSVNTDAGQRTNVYRTDPSTNQPTNGFQQKNTTEKLCNGLIRSLASVKSFQGGHPYIKKFQSDYTIYFFLYICSLFLLEFVGARPPNGGRATDRPSSDRPFNRPTDQRNPTEKYHGIRSTNCATGRFGSLPR